MKLLVIILNKVEFLDDLLSLMVEVGISKATILDSEGMGQHLAHDIPIFAGLKSLVGNAKTYNKTILSLIEDESCIFALEKLLKKMEIELNDEGIGVLFTLDVQSLMKLNSN